MIKDLLEIFQGDPNKHLMTSLTGEVNEKGKREANCWEEKKPVTESLWQTHLDGKQRIGIFPIHEDKIKWGCIDIDPRNYKDYSSKKYIDIITNYKLPLIPVKSKSGGLHLFIFFKEWTNLKEASAVLDDWNNKYFGSSEVIPPQKKALNMPYFKVNATSEHAFDSNGNGLLVGAFIELVKANLCDIEKIKQIKTEEPEEISLYSEYPPCVQNLMREKWAGNHRNDMLFNVGVLIQKEHDGNISPTDLGEKLLEKNKEVFTSPLNDREVTATVLKSLTKNKEYFYKCPPRYNGLVPICNKEECKKRKLGLNKEEQVPDLINEFKEIKFTKELKSITYSFKFKDQEIYLNPEDMKDEKSFRVKLLNYKIFWKTLPRVKNGLQLFELLMSNLVERAEENENLKFEETLTEEQYNILKGFFESHVEEDAAEKLKDKYVTIDKDDGMCYFKKSTLTSFLDKGKRIFNNTQEALNLLGCERVEYYKKQKNVWKVKMPDFVNYRDIKKKTPKGKEPVSELEDEYHTGKF